MTRLYRPGLPVDVKITGDGAPASVFYRDAWHPVDIVCNHWRVTATWWSGPANRDYWKMTTTGGLLLTLYRELDTCEWFVERLYD